jgi:hypothetical protein
MQHFGNWICFQNFVFSSVFLEYWTMDKVQEPSNSYFTLLCTTEVVLLHDFSYQLILASLSADFRVWSGGSR